MEKFRNRKLPAAERAASLLALLTPEEKAAQLNYRNPGIPRLKLPPYVWWNEALHGLARAGAATVFPQAIAMAAAFTPELVRAMGEVIALEGRVRNAASRLQGDFGTYKGLTYWSPNVNIFRDPRWGRGHETYGECPWLSGECGAAYVRGVQGPDPEHPRAVATPKHFAVHSGPEAGRADFNSAVSDTDLFRTYLPAFRKCVAAGAGSVMSAYNAVNGVPCSVNAYLLNDILRGRWGFDGAVVTDAGAGDQLVSAHHAFDDFAHSVAAEIRAGVDVLTDAGLDGLAAWRAGLLTPEEIDRAVLRQLTVKIRLGWCEEPDASLPYELLEAPRHRRLALEAARRSVVLLKNERAVLPLDRKRLRRLAVIGPNAANREILLGNYHGTPTVTVTPLEGIIAQCGAKIRVLAAKGCEHIGARTEPCGEDFDRLAEARSCAENADAVLLFLGLTPQYEGEAGDAFNSEAAGDKTTLALPEIQLRLLREVRQAAKKKPLILVMVSGSALIVPERECDAVLQCFYPGAEGGTALAEILFGKVNPSGKLPLTFYASDADLPPFRDYAMAGRTYRYFTGEPQYPFGYGLSYTSFACRDLEQGRGGRWSVTVANTGERTGEEVAQLYAECDVPGHPRRQLVGVRRLRLKPGQSRRVTFKVDPGDLAELIGAEIARYRCGDAVSSCRK